MPPVDIAHSRYGPKWRHWTVRYMAALVATGSSGPGTGTHRIGARVTIADDGSGIQQNDLTRIFEPFYSTKGDEGTGLGLWLSHGIVQKHEGSIRVRSRTTTGSSGTVFSVFLPDTAGRTQAVQPLPGGGRKRREPDGIAS